MIEIHQISAYPCELALLEKALCAEPVALRLQNVPAMYYVAEEFKKGASVKLHWCYGVYKLSLNAKITRFVPGKLFCLEGSSKDWAVESEHVWSYDQGLVQLCEAVRIATNEELQHYFKNTRLTHQLLHRNPAAAKATQQFQVLRGQMAG
jgi:hypothetical protein